MLETQLTDVRKMVELILSLSVVHCDGRGKVNHSGEHGDIQCRHFLAAHNDATIHRCTLNLLPSVHIHTRASYAVVCALDNLHNTHIQRVLVLVEQYQGVSGQ